METALPASHADISDSDPKDVRRAGHFLTESADRFEDEGSPGTAHILRVLALAPNEQELIRRANEGAQSSLLNQVLVMVN